MIVCFAHHHELTVLIIIVGIQNGFVAACQGVELRKGSTITETFVASTGWCDVQTEYVVHP